MNRIAIAALMCVATAQSVAAQEHSAEAVASAVLHGFLARDANVIGAHTNETNERLFAQIADGVRGATELWTGTRGEAGTTWDGLILPARFRGTTTAIVPFAIEAEGGSVASLQSGAAGRYISVVLTLDGPDDTSWGFEDINFIPPHRYEGYSATR
jgi:hypothetical protein